MSKTIELTDELAELLATPEDQADALLMLRAARRLVERASAARIPVIDEDDSDLAPETEADIEETRLGVADSRAGRRSPTADVVARLRSKYPRPVPADSAA